MDTFRRGGEGSTPFHSFWGCFYLLLRSYFWMKIAQKIRIYPQKMISISVHRNVTFFRGWLPLLATPGALYFMMF